MDIKSYLLENYNDITINIPFILTDEIRNDICTSLNITKRNLSNLIKENRNIFKYEIIFKQKNRIYYLTLLHESDNIDINNVYTNFSIRHSQV